MEPPTFSFGGMKLDTSTSESSDVSIKPISNQRLYSHAKHRKALPKRSSSQSVIKPASFNLSASTMGLPGSTLGLAWPDTIKSVGLKYSSGSYVKYNPPAGSDWLLKDDQSSNINTLHQCITAMKDYENKSLEELRMEDYLLKRRSAYVEPNASATKYWSPTAMTTHVQETVDERDQKSITGPVDNGWSSRRDMTQRTELRKAIQSMGKTAEHGHSSTIELMSNCALCQKPLEDPRNIQCPHSFCRECVEQHVDKQEMKDAIVCPICNYRCPLPAEGIQNLPRSICFKHLQREMHSFSDDHVDKKSETVIPVCTGEYCGGKRAAVICSDGCGPLCSDCKSTHSTISFLKNHSVIDIAQVKDNLKYILSPCLIHPHETLDLYCDVCSVPICPSCLVLGHSSHQCTGLSSKVESLQKVLDFIMEEANQRIKQLRGIIANLINLPDKVLKDVDQVKEEVSKLYRELHSQLYREEKQKLTNLSGIYGDAVKAISLKTDQQMRVAEELTDIQSCSSYLRTKGKQFDFLRNVPILYMQLQTYFPSDVEWISNITRAKTPQVKSDVGQFLLTDEHDELDLKLKISIDLPCEPYGLGILSTGHTVVLCGETLYFYNGIGELQDKHESDGLFGCTALCVTSQEEHDERVEFIVTAHDHTFKYQLNWWKISNNNGKLLLADPVEQTLSYRPTSLHPYGQSQIIVADQFHSQLHIYCSPTKQQQCLQLSSDIKPVEAITGSNVEDIMIRHSLAMEAFIVVNEQGNCVRRYDCGVDVSVDEIQSDGEGGWFVADYKHGYIYHLGVECRFKRRYQFLRDMPVKLCVDSENGCLWAALWGLGNIGKLYRYSIIRDDKKMLIFNAII